MADEVRFQRVTAARALELNPVLGLSEPCHEYDTGKFKIGDGVTPWSELPYYDPFGNGGSGLTYQDLLNHINDLTPHPVYDDGPSLALLYENAKV